MVALRAERAQLLGFATFADYRLDDQMAKTPAGGARAARRGLGPRARQGASRARRAAGDDRARRAATSRWRRRTGAITPRSCARRATISTRPRSSRTSQLDNMIAGRLRDRAPAVRPDLHAGRRAALSPRRARLGSEGRKTAAHVGLFIGDYFARASKHCGAWMTSLRDQEKLVGDVRPIILNVCNFSKPAAGEPALLSFDDARTLFHEFGHGAARPVVERDLSAARRHRGAERFRRAALAALRALAGSAGDPAALRAPRRDRRADAAGAARPAAGDAHLQPGLRHRRIHRLRAGRSRSARAAGRGRARRRRFERDDA